MKKRSLVVLGVILLLVFSTIALKNNTPSEFTPMQAQLVQSNARFDFGTATSPVEAGYTRVVHTAKYTPELGYGWLSGTVDSRDRGAGAASDLKRDLNYTSDATFVMDVPNGKFTVTLTTGDYDYPRDQEEISLEGTVVDTISVLGRKFVTKTYPVTVTDGQLTLRLRDAGGANPATVINGLAVEQTEVFFSEKKFDFGTATSPVATDYTRVTHTTKYSAEQGFGWQNGTVDSRDRGTGANSDLNRDLNFTSDGTFTVDVPNGTFDVTLTTGDYDYPRDQEEISLEGTVVDTISVLGRKFVTKTYQVTVADKQLTVRLRDAGGQNPATVINGLVIQVAGLHSAPPPATSSSAGLVPSSAPAQSSASSAPSADTTAPTIGSVTAADATHQDVRIMWGTNEAATTQIEYGKTVSYGLQTTLDTALAFTHQQQLTSLEAGTQYHYRVLSKDAAGNTARSGDFAFQTQEPPDTTPPVMTSITAQNLTFEKADISWTTDELGSTQIEYGIDSSYGSSTQFDSSLSTNHMQTLSGLEQSMLYHYRVRSTDAKGNEAVSEDRTFSTPGPTLNVPITIKETAGVGATQYPITVVVPLHRGRFKNTNSMRLTDAAGNTVAAQFEVLNRWWVDGNTVRHVAIHFQPTVGAFTTANTGMAVYTLKNDGNSAPQTPLKTIDTSDTITVVTGPLKFTVDKKNFTIIDEAWLDQNKDGVFSSDEQVIRNGGNNGGVFSGRVPTDIQKDSARSDIAVVIEESGPLQTVIRAEAVTKFVSTENHTHGWAVRIYAYANKPFVKVDYQLQNSDKKVKKSWPLYFQDLRLNLALTLDPANSRAIFGFGNNVAKSRSVGNGIYMAQEKHNVTNVYDTPSQNKTGSGVAMDGSMGWIDIQDESKGVTAVIRNFWQMWPNGLEAQSDGTLAVQLFPEWSAMWHQKQLSPTGLYWLDDMQHVYKEVLLNFHDANIPTKELHDLSRTFNTPPVGFIAPSWYNETKATADMGGTIPNDQWVTGTDTRQAVFPDNRYYDTATTYNFNWVNYFADVSRKVSNGTGGAPDSGLRSVATGNPSDYFMNEAMVQGEMNARPIWLSGYTHAADWNFLKLTDNPYGGKSYRAGTTYSTKIAAPYLEGTSPTEWTKRDDAHAWYYQLEEFYYLSGNPWIRDFYNFMKEFRRVRLNHLDPYPDSATRASAHAFASALQAYRITGDTEILELLQAYFTKYTRAKQSPLFGNKAGEDAPFQVGYLTRMIASYLEEIQFSDPQAFAEVFNLMTGYIEWNYNFAKFSYYIDASVGVPEQSNGTSMSLIDPIAWYYDHTGKEKYMDQVNQYITVGIPAGVGKVPYFNPTIWTGQWEARVYPRVKNTVRTDMTPPAPITDLAGASQGTQVALRWTAPADAVRYHIVYSDKPIVEENSIDTTVTNWWAADAIGPSFAPQAGQTETIAFTPKSPTVYAAIFTFDARGNMSTMSNLVTVTLP